MTIREVVIQVNSHATGLPEAEARRTLDVFCRLRPDITKILDRPSPKGMLLAGLRDREEVRRWLEEGNRRVIQRGHIKL